MPQGKEYFCRAIITVKVLYKQLGVTVNSIGPFPIRAKYAWNACVGVLPCLDGLGDITGVRDDYVMAGVYTRIYMALMGNISIRLTSV